MSSKNQKLSTLQLMLMSTGGMIGAGWLFSPYYGFQTAGLGVLLSWLIIAVLTLIIGVAFAEVVTLIPIVGGLSRFIGVTHNRTIAFMFLVLGWMSYVVYLPLEAQSAIQYLSFWYKDLVVQTDGATTLSGLGLAVAFAIIIFLTWFNTLLLKNVARANFPVSVWKIIVPIGIAWILIALFGDWENVKIANMHHAFSLESALLAITSSGIAFAFTGFQNGLILANSVSNPKKALPYSLFAPIIIGFILYSSLSLVYITCMGDKELAVGSAAPLLGVVSLFGIHIIITVLFIDAVVAPLGTANVYTAATARVLYGLAKDFFPKGLLNKLNKFSAPVYCLWLNALVGACFLMPFPTWQQLVDFLSSIVIFSYLAGPVTLLVLRQDFPNLDRPFKVMHHKLIGYGGFACCSLLIYWSSFNNLIYLTSLVAAIIFGYNLFVDKKPSKLINALKTNFFVIAYLLVIVAVKYLHREHLVAFPIDNLLIIIISCASCKIFISNKIDKEEIQKNLKKSAAESD
ncbi:MAG: APC family permease [Rickettsiales bacterium]|nr:APC family permease [Rickettsiales bacterium]